MGNQGATASDHQWLFRHPRISHPNEWLTPPHIIEALGPFDLDPAAPMNRPWPTAKAHFTRLENGLLKPWRGRVWLNPPYGPEVVPFVQRMADHGNGIALLFARTDSSWFHDYVFGAATAIFFVRSRIFFHHLNGARSRKSATAPVVLAAYGNSNARSLDLVDLDGKKVML